jgi:GNAT superfamily N-acetyltransferase
MGSLHRSSVLPDLHPLARAQTLLIRSAVTSDWPHIWPFFSSIVEAGDSYAYPDDLDATEASVLWMEQPPGETIVAVIDDVVVGTAKMGPNRPGRGSHVATASFMVDPNHRGKGVGAALCEWVLSWATRSGYRSIQFNAVVETNTAAVALWQRLGFEIIATVPEAFEHRDQGLVGLHVMYRRLAP